MRKKFMKKHKQENGITLIALVVTIIILLILAGVTINLVIGENGIISKSQEAVRKHNNSVIDEQIAMNDLENSINKQSELPTDPSGNAPIPEDFYYVGGTINDGIIISDNKEDENKGSSHTVAQTLKGNQYVWISVPDISIMYDEDKKEGKLYHYDFDVFFNELPRENIRVTGVEILYVKNKKINPNYTMDMAKDDFIQDLLASAYPEEIDEIDIQSALISDAFYPEPHDVYEPRTVSSDGGAFDTVGITQQQLQNDFDKMITSVKKYKGFYIGRYETGNLSDTTAVIKSNNTDLNSVNWYTAYTKIKGMYNKNSSVVSNIIWGCQWDAIIQNFKKDTQLDAFLNSYSTSDRSYPTGTIIEEQAYNIYDMRNNRGDMTMESCADNYTRTRRDGKIRRR